MSQTTLFPDEKEVYICDSEIVHLDGDYIRFKVYTQWTLFYNDESYFGIFKVSTSANVPQAESNNRHTHKEPKGLFKYAVVITGTMEKLQHDKEYIIDAKLIKNAKFGWQYAVRHVQSKDISLDNYSRFLHSICTDLQAENISKAYPDFIPTIIDGGDVDYKKIKGVGKKNYDKIKQKVLDNFSLADIVSMLAPHGINLTMIKKIANGQPPHLVKQKLFDNPYMITNIWGIGFKRADAIALKIRPELQESLYRLNAYLSFQLEDIGFGQGHTIFSKDEVQAWIMQDLPECEQFFEEAITNESGDFVVINDQVCLKRYYIYESYILSKIKALKESEVVQTLNINDALKDALFKPTEEQIEAVRTIAYSNLLILTGNAGTGKTSTLRLILKMFRPDRVCMCALSAKAAMRMREITGITARTIHRTLEWKGEKFEVNEHNPINWADIVVLDEGGMVNSYLFYSLLKAVPEGTKFVMIFDNAQLPPIGAGNIATDILNMDL